MAHLKLKFKHVSLSTLFVFFSVLSYGVYSQVNEPEYMLMLLNALTPPPSGWSNKTDRCQWSGVHCDNWDYVDAIDLHSRSLTGTLPSGINSLSQLTRLDLHNNSLSGPLPSLANLTFLQHLDLSSNNFTSIPDGCFQGLISLQDLTMSSNTNLAPWMFPTDLTDSVILKRLDLSTTNLMGSLPDIFHQYFPKLENVLLSHNNITGVLANSFAQSKVAVLWLNDQVGYNKLSGTIEILSSMTNLVKVGLQGNCFEGPIPDLSNCTNLEVLQLEDNRLTGVVPPSLMSLPWLMGVYLDNNFLQGPVPLVPKLNTHGTVEASLGVNTTNGFCLDHAGPCDPRVTTLLEIAAAFGYPYPLARSWRGNNPCQHWRFIVCAEDKITTVNLTKLNLTGTISPAFGNLTYLWNLYLGDNNLKGSMPKSLETLPQLKVVDVSNNNLSGNIPRFPSAVRFIATGNVLLGLPQNSRHRSSPSASKTSLPPPRIAGISIAGAGVIVIFVVFIYNCKRCLRSILKMFKKTTSTDHNVEDFIKTYGCLAPKRYSYSKVKKMTNSFCEKLGQGGYGTVYKASLADGRQVAVKVLSESKGSGEEFINEVASISRTSHVNIVSLLGFCFERNGRAFIYEFMPNGSLDKFIYEKGSPNAICNLDWNTLYKIAIGIARGLEYLHQGCSTRILHLDIKPQNILLDEDFCPKISDFGLAKICQKKESIVSILSPRGTIGYIAPEVFSRTYGGVSRKSDVYSYDMLIIDMVGGRKNYDSGGSQTSEMYFPDWIYKDLERGTIPAWCLASTEEENNMVMKIILVSLWCIQQNPSDRPSISKVVEMLEGPLQSVSYPPKPVLCSPKRPPSQFSDVSYNSLHETNSTTNE